MFLITLFKEYTTSRIKLIPPTSTSSRAIVSLELLEKQIWNSNQEFPYYSARIRSGRTYAPSEVAKLQPSATPTSVVKGERCWEV